MKIYFEDRKQSFQTPIPNLMSHYFQKYKSLIFEDETLASRWPSIKQMNPHKAKF